MRLTAISILISIALIGCKEEGCLDEAAINFDITAKKDDGSCRYCTAQESLLADLSFNLTDNSNFSQHANEEVIAINLVQRENSFNDQSCGTNDCEYDLEITNICSSDISFYRIRLQYIDQTFSNTIISINLLSDSELKSGETISYKPYKFDFNSFKGECSTISGAGSVNNRLQQVEY